MVYPDRISDRLQSRRSPEQPRTLDSNRNLFDILSPRRPIRDSPQNQRHFNQTNTLSGAYAAAGGDNFALDNPYALGTPSPSRRGNMTMTASTSPQSNPPDEIVAAYHQMRGGKGVVDDDYVQGYLGLDGTGAGRLSPEAAERYAEDVSLDPFTSGDADFLDNVTDGSPRRSHSDYIDDERRLRHVITSQSPVLTKSGLNSGLTSEGLQRREENQEDYPEMEVEEDDRGAKLSLNLPRTWGSRATNRRSWMRNIAPRNESNSRDQVDHQAADDSRPMSRLGYTDATRPSRDIERPPRRTSLETRSALRERSTSGYNRSTTNDEQNKPVSQQKDQQSTEGGQGSNTPVSVYKHSTFNKRSPAKRDSHDLIRKLSRNESLRANGFQNENQIKTPEQAKQPERPIYDKTPVVTGAWIDTPMTEKVTELPEHLSRDIVSSPPRRQEPENPSKSIELHTDKRPPEPQPSRGREREPAEEERVERREQNEREAEREKEKGTKPPVAKPDMPGSGLEAFLLNPNANGDTPGDDTLESLQEILNEQPTEVKTEAEEDAAYEKAILKKLERASPEEPAKDDVEKIDDNLVSLGVRINEMKAGIASIEEKLKREGKHIHAGGNCSSCGTKGDGRLYAYIPLPYLWRRDPVTRRIRPTRLTWLLLLFLTWFFSESSMCDHYCRPRFATACHGNCLKPDAPEFPFVIPTMLWRWSHIPSLLAPAFTIAFAFFKLTMQLIGLWDGFVDDGPPPQALNLTGEIRIHGTRIAGFPSATSTPIINSPPQQWAAQYGQPYIPGLGVPPWEEDKSSMEDDELLY